MTNIFKSIFKAWLEILELLINSLDLNNKASYIDNKVNSLKYMKITLKGWLKSGLSLKCSLYTYSLFKQIKF